MFKRIDHVEIVSDQLDRTVQFYTDVLGFTVKSRDRIERDCETFECLVHRRSAAIPQIMSPTAAPIARTFT